jgi:hypothetical protein
MQHFRFSSLALALSALPLFVACGYGDHHHYDDGYGYAGAPAAPPSDTIEESTIDTDRLLDVDPGAGAGAFFEYESGGVYHVTTSCDVASGPDCVWDIVVVPLDGAPIQSFAPFDLESDDSLSFGLGNQLQLITNTGEDFDGFSFQTDPGAGIQIDALLDNGAANRYLFWVGDGALHQGAPSNPINLVPSED